MFMSFDSPSDRL